MNRSPEQEFALEPEQFSVEAQATNAHVLQAVAEFKSEIVLRLDALEGAVAELKDGQASLKADVAEVKATVDNAGLNGHTPLLKAFLEQYGATYVKRQAWLTVRSDIAHRFRWLRQPKSWLRTIFYAGLGGLGWEFVSHLSGFHPPHIFGLH